MVGSGSVDAPSDLTSAYLCGEDLSVLIGALVSFAYKGVRKRHTHPPVERTRLEVEGRRCC